MDWLGLEGPCYGQGSGWYVLSNGPVAETEWAPKSPESPASPNGCIKYVRVLIALCVYYLR